MTSHSDNIWHLLHCTRHLFLALWHQATIFMTSHPLNLTWYPLYLCHQTHGVSFTTPTLDMASHTLYVWHHIQYSCCHNKYLWDYSNLYITSHPVLLWHHIKHVRYHNTAFMTTQHLDLTFHPPYLTSQPLYLSHHTDGTHICIDALLYQWHHSKCVSCHIWPTYGITPNEHHNIFTLYDINDHVLSHHKHCTQDIRSPLYDITSTL